MTMPYSNDEQRLITGTVLALSISSVDTNQVQFEAPIQLQIAVIAISLHYLLYQLSNWYDNPSL
jgi:hypothetical protein